MLRGQRIFLSTERPVIQKIALKSDQFETDLIAGDQDSVMAYGFRDAFKSDLQLLGSQ